MNVAKKIITLLFCAWIFTSCSYHRDFFREEELRANTRHVAVLPLANLTSYPNAGKIIGDILATELYASTNFLLMEHTEMVDRLKSGDGESGDVPDGMVAAKAGKLLGVDSVIYGSVTEYRYKRGLDENPVVGVNIRMLDVNRGKVVWAGSHSGAGGCFWFCEDSLNRLTQKVCHEMVAEMAGVRQHREKQ